MCIPVHFIAAIFRFIVLLGTYKIIFICTTLLENINNASRTCSKETALDSIIKLLL